MPSSDIRFFNESSKYLHAGKRVLRQWIFSAIKLEGGQPGPLNIIICDDASLYEMNVNWLKHDTLTDVITFDFCEQADGVRTISGDIYISIDRVRENAAHYKVSPGQELNRVIIHGVLHLLGYSDKTPSQKKTMRQREELHLSHLASLSKE